MSYERRQVLGDASSSSAAEQLRQKQFNECEGSLSTFSCTRGWTR